MNKLIKNEFSKNCSLPVRDLQKLPNSKWQGLKLLDWTLENLKGSTISNESKRFVQFVTCLLNPLAYQRLNANLLCMYVDNKDIL